MINKYDVKELNKALNDCTIVNTQNYIKSMYSKDNILLLIIDKNSTITGKITIFLNGIFGAHNYYLFKEDF